jgi:ABC-type branched-subunit amino acid transport system permease subunit
VGGLIFYAAALVMVAGYSALFGIMFSGCMTRAENVSFAALSVLVGYALKTCVVYYQSNKKGALTTRVVYYRSHKK